MDKKTMMHVVKFESGKTFGFREYSIEDYDLAAKMAVRTAGDNQMLFAMGLQKELLKLLLVEVEGKKVDHMQKEKLDNLMSPAEYMALLKFVGELSGNEKILTVSTKTLG